MITATLNGRPLYAKGTMDVKMFDPATNDLVYYSNKMSTSQLASTINLGPINAGIGNPIVIQIPDTPSLTMNLTAADFSLEGRALSVGGNVVYNGVVPVDEAVEANGTTLTVMQTPVAPLGGCNVVGYINNGGTAYPIDPDTKQIQGFTAVAGTTYCVHYYTTNPSAKQLSIETLMNPAVVRGFITIPVYSTEGSASNANTGSRVGSLYITIPRGQLSGDASTEGSQTTAATTVMNLTALSYDEACEQGIQCGGSSSPKLAYMVLELFGNPDQNVESLAIVGGNDITVTAGSPYTIPVKYEMDNGEKMYSIGGSQSDWALLSLMARLNYSYEDKYLLTATVRRDGSSRFGKNNRWGTFPSVSLAWRISQEEWFPKDNSPVNDLKLRIGYGVTGNQEIGNYGFVASYNTGVYPFGNNNSTALVSTTLSNPNIHWEEVRQTNFGVDMSLFNSRVNLSLDAYIKKTADMLVKASIPITSGFEDTTETFTNAGKMRNKGVEMTLRTINLKGLFSWESALTATYNKNEILDLNSETPMFINQMGNSYVTMLRAGYPINVFYGYVTDGLFQNWEEVNRHATQPGAAPGDIRFRDLNNDGVINDEDRTVIGNPNPNWFFSLSNNFSYKGWELSVFLQGVSGNKIYNANNVDNEGMAAAYNQTTAVLNRWTGEGTSNSMPRAIWGDPNQNCRVSDRFVENGSYLRLKNITLSYTLPKKWMQKIQLENARISFSCENVATITGYSGFDPEVDINGIDSSRYPISRTFSMGLNFNF